jgi:hypothetical protein
MHVELIYPSNAVWFLRASESEIAASEGSAVAVRLRRKGDAGPFQNYLLTCAHVIRKADRKEKLGPCYADIRAWQPGDGYNPVSGGRKVMPVAAVLPAKCSDPTTFYQKAVDNIPNADWALLQFQDANTANDQELPVVHSFLREPPTPEFQCVVHGFPGGSTGFEGHHGAKRNIVTPPQPLERPIVKSAIGGLVEFNGAQTRQGMSGGGVFATDSSTLVALHRAKDDLPQVLQAVSIHQITQVLKEIFEFAPAVDQSPIGVPGDPAYEQFLGLLKALTAAGATWTEAFARALPRSSTYELPAPGSNDGMSARHALQELAPLGRDEIGIQPIFRFADQLRRSPGITAPLQKQLDDWLRSHCPDEQWGQLSTARPAEVRGEPRIVIHMTQADTNSEKHPPAADLAPQTANEEQYHYQVWFLGFPNSPVPLESTDSRDGIRSVLERAWAAVSNQQDPARVWVELFLPKSLFCWAIEREKVRIRVFKSPIGARHRFVLRSERVESSEQMETRWNKAKLRSQKSKMPIRWAYRLSLEAIGKEDRDQEHFLVALDGNPDPDQVNSMFHSLLREPRVLGVFWQPPPVWSTISDQPDVWDAAIESGVPLLIWLRQPPPQPGDAGAPQTLFEDKQWDALAAEVQRIRLDAVDKKEWHPGHHLAILLDDPRRPLPSVSQGGRFLSPTTAR